jgi:hypothetical protein
VSTRTPTFKQRFFAQTIASYRRLGVTGTIVSLALNVLAVAWLAIAIVLALVAIGYGVTALLGWFFEHPQDGFGQWFPLIIAVWFLATFMFVTPLLWGFAVAWLPSRCDDAVAWFQSRPWRRKS